MIKPLSIILFCMFPLFALSQETEQGAEQEAAPKTADGETTAEAEASQTDGEVELSEEQRKYNRCVADLLFIVYKNTANCVAFVPVDSEGNPDMDKAAPCFHITAKSAKRIIPTCEPLLSLGPNEEAPAAPQEFTQNDLTAVQKAKEKINFDLSENQKKYDLCIAHLLGSVFQGTYKCVFSSPSPSPSEAEEDICFNRSTKALTNVFPSCEGFLNPKPNEEPAEQQTE